MVTGFWSGETLGRRLPELIEPFAAGRVDDGHFLAVDRVAADVGEDRVG